jgi:hypothetical protein
MRKKRPVTRTREGEEEEEEETNKQNAVTATLPSPKLS